MAQPIEQLRVRGSALRPVPCPRKASTESLNFPWPASKLGNLWASIMPPTPRPSLARQGRRERRQRLFFVVWIFSSAACSVSATPARGRQLCTNQKIMLHIVVRALFPGRVARGERRTRRAAVRVSLPQVRGFAFTTRVPRGDPLGPVWLSGHGRPSVRPTHHLPLGFSFLSSPWARVKREKLRRRHRPSRPEIK